MNVNWLAGHKDKEKRKKQVLTYKPVLDDLISVIEKSVKKKDNVRDYDKPNWELRQIAVNEYNQALSDLIELIKLKE